MTTTQHNTRPNKYAGRCSRCDQPVPANAGILGPKNDAGRWTVLHAGDTCPAVEAAPVARFTPTAEQQTTINLFAQGDSMVVEAGAGTGKTSTLRLLAEWMLTNQPGKRALYVAFSKKVVDEIGATMPGNVTAMTAHALALAGTPDSMRRRWKSSNARMDSNVIARHLGINPIQTEGRTLAAGFLAGHVMRAISQFCKTADPTPNVRHFAPIDAIDSITDDGTRRYEGSNMVARTLLPALERAWADLSSPTGILRYDHQHYLKQWQLGNPTIDADVIFVDECQDLSPVMNAAYALQDHAQRVYVGDSAQSIMGFTGAIDAIGEQKALGLPVARLTKSFRFGEAIATYANTYLEKLGADLRLVGHDPIPSIVGTFDGDGTPGRPDALLTRTNACAVDAILAAREAGVVAHLVGGGEEVLRFARAARDLNVRGTTSHPELAIFDSWAAVQAYVADDPQGSDLELNVRLVDKYGVDGIIAALENMPSAADATLTVSTAHKAKGLEWDRVRIGSDFAPKQKNPNEPIPEPSTEALKLLYVAVTRAKLALDATVLDTNSEA